MTPGQAALLRKAQRNLKAAEVLVEKRYYDIAVSRAYYAMFYAAQAFLLGDGLSFSKHSGVSAAFGQHFAKTGRVPTELHGYLLDGAESRNEADYDDEEIPTREDAEDQIARATEFLRVAEQIIGTPGPPA
jgi:uncharacterized protein (UPF0332 family)